MRAAAGSSHDRSCWLCASRLTRRARLGGVLLALGVVACGAQSSPTSSGLAGLTDSAGVEVAPARPVNSALGDYLAGNFALDTGLLDEAADYFERALAAAPDNLDLLRQLYLLTLASGRNDAALEQARLLAERDPEADEARLLLAARSGARRQLRGRARGACGTLDAEGIAGLTAPFLDAWAVFGEGGPKATDDALARLAAGESLGPLNGYHSAMMLDLGGRLDQAAATLRDAMPGDGPAPVRIVQAYASILARHDERARGDRRWCATSWPTGATCRCWSTSWRPSRAAACRSRRSPMPRRHGGRAARHRRGAAIRSAAPRARSSTRASRCSCGPISPRPRC